MYVTRSKVPSLNDVIHLDGGGSFKRRQYSISLFIKMGNKGEGAVKNLKKWVTSFMDGPQDASRKVIYYEKKTLDIVI